MKGEQSAFIHRSSSGHKYDKGGSKDAPILLPVNPVSGMQLVAVLGLHRVFHICLSYLWLHVNK